MTKLVVDTDIASLMWRDALPWQLDRSLIGHKPTITFVTLGEALAGTHSARWTDHRGNGLRSLYTSTFGLLSWRDTIPETCAILHGRTAALGHTLGPNDCWIAACCVSHDLPLLTRNASTSSRWNRSALSWSERRPASLL